MEREEYTAEEHTFTKRFQTQGEMHGGIYVSHMLVAVTWEKTLNVDTLRTEIHPVGDHLIRWHTKLSLSIYERTQEENRNW